MSTMADIAVRGVAGLFVVTAVLLTAWVARDSVTGSGAAPAGGERESDSLYSARQHRAPVRAPLSHRSGRRSSKPSH
jgi:hypothetical protein